jgi:adenylosuccinate lyase
MKNETRRHDRYENPLISRYATQEMAYIFSDDHKFGLWRRLWIALAECERALGLDISPAQIAEMKRHQDDINYDAAREQERKVRHDVMAHVYAFGLQCPKARPIIHLGATSAYVQDNTDLIQMREGMALLAQKLANVIDLLPRFAERHKALPTLGFTHFQPAQLTTVGKRACLWAYDFVMDLQEIEHRLRTLPFRGAKGTTGTQASFMALFDRDERRVKRLDMMVAKKMGFPRSLPVTGQTYTRNAYWNVLSALCGIAQSASKFATDLRLLQGLKEIEEPFEAEQIGSSAMAYKRNPMRCERAVSLARYLITLTMNPAFTAATQWFERTLDDSANRRICIAEAFLAADAILEICANVAGGLVVYPGIIRKHIEAELPFMATEEIIMAAVKAGGDRQEIHERIRRHALEAARVVKEQGGENDLLKRIERDPAFSAIRPKLSDLLKPERFVGRAPQQVIEFLREIVAPIRRRYRAALGKKIQLHV